MIVRDVMDANCPVIAQRASLRELVQTFLSARCEMIPVIGEERRAVGVVSLEDLIDIFLPRYNEFLRDYAVLNDLGRFEVLFENYAHLFEEDRLVLVADAMKTEFPRLFEHDPLLKAASLLETLHIKTAPVVDGRGTLRGMVHRRDVVLSLLTGKRPATAAAR